MRNGRAIGMGTMLLLLVPLAGGNASASAAQAGAIVSGRVVDASGAPQEGARVTLQGCPGVGVSTDAGGRFELTDAPPGTHRLVATLTGVSWEDLRVVRTLDSGRVSVEFDLGSWPELETFVSSGDSASPPTRAYAAARTLLPRLLREPDVAELVPPDIDARDSVTVWAPWKVGDDLVPAGLAPPMRVVRACLACVAGERWSPDWSGYEAAIPHLRLGAAEAGGRVEFDAAFARAGDVMGRAARQPNAVVVTYVRQDDGAWVRLQDYPVPPRVEVPSRFEGACEEMPGCAIRGASCACTVTHPTPPRPAGRRSGAEWARAIRAGEVIAIAGVLTQQDSTYERATLDALADSLAAMAGEYDGRAPARRMGDVPLAALRALSLSATTPAGQARTPYLGARERLARIHREAADPGVRLAAFEQLLALPDAESAMPYVRGFLRSEDPWAPRAVELLSRIAQRNEPVRKLLADLHGDDTVRSAAVRQALTCHVWTHALRRVP